MRTTYKVLERLGGGGQAEVFRGVAETLQGFKKSVAIKRILPNLSNNPQFIAMFLDEARLSLFLQHANVVQVFDISKADDGTYFLVMEYVRGFSLRELIAFHSEQKEAIPIRPVVPADAVTVACFAQTGLPKPASKTRHFVDDRSHLLHRAFLPIVPGNCHENRGA